VKTLGLIGLGLLGAIAGQAPAASFCSEPTPPGCLSYGDVDDYCQMQVKQYLQELDTHTQCVATADAEAAKEAVRKWNCRAKGHDNCY
jgi:hypothetical protein